MSTFHESAGPQELAPFDHVQNFLRENLHLMNSMAYARKQPSFENLRKVDEQIAASKRSTLPFIETRFFAGEDPDDREAALDAVMIATEELMDSGVKLNPAKKWGIDFVSGFREGVLSDLHDEELAGRMSEGMGEIYEFTINRVLAEGLYEAQPVRRFMRKEKSKQQLTSARSIGLIAAAGWTGYMLARKNRR